MDKALNTIASTVRSWMILPARALNKLSGGRITPNHVTLVSLLGHIGVVWALYWSRPILAAALLAFFGIMDSLDGALARLQKKASVRGMFYDAVSDRAKEVLVYVGIALFLGVNPYWLGPDMSLYIRLDYMVEWIVVAVLGLSMLVSYIKAKGEMALSSSGYDTQKLNRVFADGFARYEVRMFLIVVGLLTGRIISILCLLVVLLVITCLQRLIKVSKALADV